MGTTTERDALLPTGRGRRWLLLLLSPLLSRLIIYTTLDRAPGFGDGVVTVSVSLLAVVVDCRDPLRQAEFWAQALAYKVSQRNPSEFQVSDPARIGGSLYFMKVPEPKVCKNRLHLDVVTSGSMEAEVTRLADAGAQLVEVRQDPASLDNPDTWTVMRDPEGNEFCVTSTSTLAGWD